mmetsp:Transcript_56922/g.134361  ORF Transcript_56922/g.134361 Transcript_56922/m.134361 type:complete len:493 (-) Transcript_56922:326-1804(-)
MPKPSVGKIEDGVFSSRPAEGETWKRRIGRQRDKRTGTDELFRRLDDLVNDARPTGTTGVPRAQALKSGRSRVDMLEAAVAQTRRLMAPGALEQAYTLQSGAGLIAIELKSGKIAHQSPSFQDLTSWVPVAARGNIRVSLESRDGDDFHSFCQLVVRDAGEPYGETFLGRDNVVGRSLTVRFFTRVPGPTGLRNPEWLLMVRAVKLTLVGVHGGSPAAGMRLPFFGQARIPEAIGVFTADLSGGTPQQWTLQVAHVRYLLDLEEASGTYNLAVGTLQPMKLLASVFNFEFSKEEGGGARLFSRAAARLEYVTTSALSIAQRSASWLSRKALTFSTRWLMVLNDDDTISISSNMFFTIFGGLSTSVWHNFVAGKVGYSHGGLDVMYFIADPAQALDRNLRATLVRFASTKTGGGDGHRPFVFACTWGGGNTQFCCKSLSVDTMGTKMASVEDVSERLEKLKVSPGVGLLTDGSATICVGDSHDSPLGSSPASE